MNNPRFPVLGTQIPSMLGRAEVMRQLSNGLTKPTPSHLSVVGPRFAGKSVLLKALEERMRGSESPYCATVRWDLGHQTPRSDDEFVRFLCQQLGEGIKAANNDYGEHLLAVESNEYAEICEVMDALDNEGQKLLMLWDGFDKPLSGGTLSRNLWDNLLDLCRKPSFRLVTSTREELHQLIRDEESVTSDFWGVFESVVRVTTFDEVDIDSILATVSELEFQAGARTELINWSAGFPPLFLEVLNQIIAATKSSQIDNEIVNQAATRATGKCAAVLDALWEDCSAGAKDIYIDLVGRSELLFADAGKHERTCLIEKGFARKEGNKLIACCRMLEEHIQGARQDAGSMARLFGSWDDYRSNIRGLLERRLAHISRFDDPLYRYVEISVRLLPHDPELSLNNLTSIEVRALDIIWQREFGSTRTIPPNVVAYWTCSPRDRDHFVKRMMDNNSWGVPSDRGLQVGLLQLLTGSKIGFDTKAKTTSKDSYALINAIHSFRNRNQHGNGQDMHLGVAVAVIMSCLELLACLDREMPR